MNNQIYQLYLQLTGKSIVDALHAFKNLTISKPADGDSYFESFGAGHTVNAIMQPYERFACYEFLLQEIKKIDAQKFEQIHKGTAYYFLAWTAFDIGDYEKAVFYLDSALSEDIRKSIALGESDPILAAFENPGGWLLRLDPQKSYPATRVTSNLKNLVDVELADFKTTFSIDISLNDLVNKFIIEFIKQDKDNRSVITAFYSFIYEFDDLYKMLSIRSQDFGSIEPILVHLFKGGLIFETLLIYFLNKHNFITDRDCTKPNDPVSMIDSFNDSSGFINRYCEFRITEKELEDLVVTPLGTMKNAFGVTHKLRNATGHDLRRKDIFQKPEDYQNLFRQEVAAILFIIDKEFISP